MGWPGQLWIPEKIDAPRFAKAVSKVQLYALRHIDFFPSKGITFVAVDCPTDQWGSVSSRCLAIRLGDQIQGSIHSASMSTYAGPRFPDYGSSIAQIDMSKASAPWLFFHHQNDRCPSTAFAPVQSVAGSRLTTVRGGTAEGDPCGGGHLHSYQGRELVVLKAMAHWILTGERVEFVGEAE